MYRITEQVQKKEVGHLAKIDFEGVAVQKAREVSKNVCNSVVVSELSLWRDAAKSTSGRVIPWQFTSELIF